MKKTLAIVPQLQPIVREFKLVQDTRINPNVIHIYTRGVDYPIAQLVATSEGIGLARFGTGNSNELAKEGFATEKDSRGQIVIKLVSPVIDGPTSDEAFPTETEQRFPCGGGAMTTTQPRR